MQRTFTLFRRKLPKGYVYYGVADVNGNVRLTLTFDFSVLCDVSGKAFKFAREFSKVVEEEL